jgi:dolichyl-phosphate-mannose-protein mannosyltransferase
MIKLFTPKRLLIIILLFTFFSRIYRIDYPNKYVFDEVYHAFTAKEYLHGSKAAWEWWTSPPPGVAYEWTHPPLAKEIMTASMFILKTESPWAWRLPGVIMGTLIVYLVYLLGKMLFNKEEIGLLAAFLVSIDGLLFVQSRTGMNDIYFVGFSLVSLAFFLRKKFIYSAIFFGLALSSKWTTIYLLGLYIVLLFRYGYIKNIIYFLLIVPAVYMLSYLPFFMLGHDLNTFKQLQQQMWWYHTGLKATHDYASPWWSWPLNLYPVWYFVDYVGDRTANIFASGNPIFFWSGLIALILCFIDVFQSFVKDKHHHLKKAYESLFITVLGYSTFILPWALSPRIMFLYHYSPSIPFLSLALGYQLNLLNNKKYRLILILVLILLFEGFLFTYPFLTGIPLPHSWVKIFFSTNITKDPFNY